jgi:Zn ribbon nucleic-acid-binding protein
LGTSQWKPSLQTRKKSISGGYLNMTWKTTASCPKCGAYYELDVWDLGHKDSDLVICECCGEVVKKWKNEARSYSIARTISRGSLHIKHEDWEQYKDKKLRFIRGDDEVIGIMKGLGFDKLIALSPEKYVHPWLIQTKEDNVLICPEAGWIICLGE